MRKFGKILFVILFVLLIFSGENDGCSTPEMQQIEYEKSRQIENKGLPKLVKANFSNGDARIFIIFMIFIIIALEEK